MKIIALTIAFVILATVTIAGGTPGSAAGWATWYSRQSCLAEGNSGITASGKPLRDSAPWCAIPKDLKKEWNMKFGDELRVTNLANNRTVTVRLMDIGPGKKARRRGVVMDLTPAAFRSLGVDLKQGRVKIKMDKIKIDKIKMDKLGENKTKRKQK